MKQIVLVGQVKQICDWLADHGWRDLLLEHDLDITADNFKEELLKSLAINWKIKGFEDFALEGTRGIEPGHPARSLLILFFYMRQGRVFDQNLKCI